MRKTDWIPLIAAAALLLLAAPAADGDGESRTAKVRVPVAEESAEASPASAPKAYVPPRRGGVQDPLAESSRKAGLPGRRI